jgi:uncharacterized protein
MAMELYEAVKARRSVYGLSRESTISDDRLEGLVLEAVKNAPSAFNSQSGRAILLLGAAHDEFWDATKGILRGLVPDEATFEKTAEKVSGFKSSHGTVLFFEDWEVVRSFQEKFPLYKENFAIWSGNSAGMLQYLVWTSLAAEGMGASLQHYNPLVDEWVGKRFDLPASWKLTAEMPFGKIASPAGEKEFLPLEGRFRVFGR